jgi:hypothetical protein
MTSWWENIGIKKGTGGCGDVTEEQKNSTIDHAVSTWERMGLSEDEIAFGIGVMGLESGFNPHAKSTDPKSPTEYGFSQFTDDTWKDAVDFYNTRPEHDALGEQKIDPVNGRRDPGAQIAVMGPWIRKTWKSAATIPPRQRPKGYSLDEIAYGKWNQGQSKAPKEIGEFLAHPKKYHNANKRGYFTTNVDRARQLLRMRKEGGWVSMWGQP